MRASLQQLDAEVQAQRTYTAPGRHLWPGPARRQCHTGETSKGGGHISPLLSHHASTGPVCVVALARARARLRFQDNNPLNCSRRASGAQAQDAARCWRSWKAPRQPKGQRQQLPGSRARTGVLKRTCRV